MSVMLATLCLNEMQWLPKLYEQHKDWPELKRWVFVEAADRVYAQTNPHMVSNWLSVDGTTEFLTELQERDPRVTYIAHGVSRSRYRAMCKAEARQRYLDLAERVAPEFLIVLDADEFYTKADQAAFLEWMRKPIPKSETRKLFRGQALSWIFPRREIWHPPSLLDEPLFNYEVVGGFWDIACCHWWRWQSGMHHRACHVTPSIGRIPMNQCIYNYVNHEGVPQLVHMGYAALAATRAAKNRYYESRGEALDRQRQWYTRSRAAWETWVPGGKLPDKAIVKPYTGPIPEVFREDS
jgi:hypothetical protein